MVGEMFAGLGAFKSMLDLAQALKGMNDAVVRNTAVIELTEKILAAQRTQAALQEEISELKKRVVELEASETDKQNYEPTELAPGIICYVEKGAVRGTDSFRPICANCYSAGKKSFLQRVISGQYYDEYKCDGCKATLPVDKGNPPSLYVAPEFF